MNKYCYSDGLGHFVVIDLSAARAKIATGHDVFELVPVEDSDLELLESELDLLEERTAGC